MRRGYQSHQAANPHTPQDPAEDSPKHWNYQKIKWLFFFSFLFLQMASEILLEFHSGEPAADYGMCTSAPLAGPQRMDGAGPRMQNPVNPHPSKSQIAKRPPKK